MNNRILLIGGGGFIGSSLSNRLCRLNYEVHVCGRSPTPRFYLDSLISYHSIKYDYHNILDFFANFDCLTNIKSLFC